MNQPEPGVFPRFYTDSVLDKRATEEKGMTVYKDQEFVEIHTAGNRTNVVVSKVKPHHIDRWPEYYKAFKDGLEAPVDGTPLANWQALSKAQADTLKAAKIHTVEALANLPDSALPSIGMGARELVAKAKAFLDVSKDLAEAQKYAAENERMASEIDLLKEQIKELSAKVDKPKPKAKKAEAA